MATKEFKDGHVISEIKPCPVCNKIPSFYNREQGVIEQGMVFHRPERLDNVGLYFPDHNGQHCSIVMRSAHKYLKEAISVWNEIVDKYAASPKI